MLFDPSIHGMAPWLALGRSHELDHSFQRIHSHGSEYYSSVKRDFMLVVSITSGSTFFAARI